MGFGNITTIPYTLTYVAGAHGTISGAAFQIVEQGSSGAPVTAVPDANHHFTQWTDGVSIASRTDANVQGDVTATAVFAIDTHALTYDGNGNTGGTAPIDGGSPYNYNTTVTVAGPGDLTRTDNTFTGWNTAANGSGTPYAMGDTFSLIADTTLFAQWVNIAPVAVADTVLRPDTTSVTKVLLAVLLANDSDPANLALSITGVGGALPAGATVTISGAFVAYAAPGPTAGDGSFTYTVSNGAQSATGTVLVKQTTSGNQAGAPNALKVTHTPAGRSPARSPARLQCLSYPSGEVLWLTGAGR